MAYGNYVRFYLYNELGEWFLAPDDRRSARLEEALEFEAKQDAETMRDHLPGEGWVVRRHEL